MGPTTSEVHVNRPLTNLMVQYTQSLDAFIADKVFPAVPVLKRSDLYFSIPKDAWFKAGAVERAPGVESAGIGYDVNPNNSYFAKVWAAHFDLSDQVRTNYDTPLAADATAMRFIARNLMITRELQWMQRFFQPGIWSGLNAPGSTTNVDYNVIANGHGAWDSDTSDPVKDIRSMQTYIQSKTGYIPEILVLAKDVYDAACNNKSILDRIRYTQKGILTTDLLAGIFQVKKLLVAQAVLNTAQTGKTASMGFMSANSFLLCYAPDAPSIQDASAGYIFTWTGYAGAGAMGNVMANFRMPHLRADRFEGEMAYDMKQVASDLGAFGTNVLNNP